MGRERQDEAKSGTKVKQEGRKGERNNIVNECRRKTRE